MNEGRKNGPQGPRPRKHFPVSSSMTLKNIDFSGFFKLHCTENDLLIDAFKDPAQQKMAQRN